MKRRTVIGGLVAGTTAGILPSKSFSQGAPPQAASGHHQKHPLTGDSSAYFLSDTNPVATTDQRDLEILAMRVRDMPVVREARKQSAFLWRQAYGHDGFREEAEPLFESAMDEFAFNFILKAVNSDGNYPRVVQLFMPPHHWFGMDVPGSRMGGDNPDNCYRIIPIAHDGQYEIRGRCPPESRPSSVTYTLMANYGTSKTIMTLEQDDIVYEEDGTFIITIDSAPAAGRPNHLTSTPAVKVLFVRDSLNDWAAQTPTALTVRRLNQPGAEPMSEEAMAALAVDIMLDNVSLYYWFTRLCSGKRPNTLLNPTPSASLGGLVTQTGIQAYLRLADDDAMVITYDPAGAKYSGPVMQDWWFRTIDYWNSQTSLTMGHSLPNADGTVTVVVSPTDPAVHNWIGTGGLNEVLVVQRWQGLPKRQQGKGPAIEAQLVKLNALDAALPGGMVRVTPEQRREQLALRRAAYHRRLVDH